MFLMGNHSSQNKGDISRNETGETSKKSFFSFSYRTWDSIFRSSLKISAVFLFLLIGAMIVSLIIFSFPVIKQTGLKILYGTNWDPGNDEFGGLPFIAGTIITSVLALIIAVPFALSVSVFLGEYFRSGPLSTIVNAAIELSAGIPSIIYGAWGLYVLVPIVQKRQASMDGDAIAFGVSILSASILLSIMIIPFAASISREIITMVPQDLKEASYALGSTRYEMIKNVAVPYASSGIFAGLLLAFGRALGETMAVTMVIGNLNEIPKSLFAPGNTIASVIANEFAEASDLHISALTEIGLILFLLTIVIGFLGRMIIVRMSVK